jgi:hypothetical protein
MFRLIRDSRGAPSWSHTLAVPASVLITLWFLAGGLDVTVGTVHVITATKAGAEYALALAPWLAYLAQRETVQKRLDATGPTPTPSVATAAAPGVA